MKTLLTSAAYLLFSALAAAVLCTSPLAAKTTLSMTTGSGVAMVTPELEIIQQFQEKMDLNGPAWANAYAFSNTTGYASGKATLGDFPHFETGLLLNAGLTNTTNFQHSRTGVYNGTMPGVGFYPSTKFGIGLGGGFDILGKLYTINKDLYSPKVSLPMLELKEFSLYAVGGRLRYNIVKEKPVIPFLFSFGGVTLSTGIDMMRGLISIGGDYQMPLSDINITVSGFALPPLNSMLNSTYTAALTWYQLSWTSQATVYFELFKIFSMYTGVGLSLGYGWFQVSFDVEGTLSSTDIPAPFSQDIATLTVESKNRYNPYRVIPTYLLGLEFNIPFVKIIAESQVNLRNRADVTLSTGVRLAF